MHITNELAQSLKDERAELVRTLERFDSKQGASGTTYLTLAEEESYAATKTRMDQIDQMLARSGGFDAIAAVHREIGLAGEDVGTSAGEQLLILGRAALGNLGVAKYHDAITEAEMLTRALQHGVSGDGTAPVTVEGELVKFVDANRYAVNASRRIPMPQNRAETFKRPRVTQHAQVGTQAAQGDVLASRRLTTTGDTITKQTEGGTLALSEQEIDWTDPAMLGLAIQDLAEQYAIDTDTVLTAAIEAKVTSNVTTLALDAGPQDFAVAFAEAAGAVYDTSKKVPDTVYASVDRWVYLLGLTDDDGRPLFPAGGGTNTLGSLVGATGFSGNVNGLRLVVDPNFSDGTLIVAASQLVEFYEQDKGLLSVNAPSTLEVIYAYRGYVATNVYAAGLQGLAPA
jgi:hypothetical protein